MASATTGANSEKRGACASLFFKTRKSPNLRRFLLYLYELVFCPGGFFVAKIYFAGLLTIKFRYANFKRHQFMGLTSIN
jgi:hypothetical protein